MTDSLPAQSDLDAADSTAPHPTAPLGILVVAY